jgi:hypothetical protein
MNKNKVLFVLSIEKYDKVNFERKRIIEYRIMTTACMKDEIKVN